MFVKNLLRFSYPVLLFFGPTYLFFQVNIHERGRSFTENMGVIVSGWVGGFSYCMEHVQGVLLYAALFCLLLLWLWRPSWLVGIALFVSSLFAGPLCLGMLMLLSSFGFF